MPKTTSIQFSEFRDGNSAEKFVHCVESASTRTTFKVTSELETTTYWRGKRIIGKQTRDLTGYRYYIRID